MAEVKRLELAKLPGDPKTVELARDLVKDCESGDVQAFFAIAECRGGHYTHFGSANKNRTTMAGRLLEAALLELGFVQQQDD